MSEIEPTAATEERRASWARRLLLPAKLALLVGALFLAARLVAGAGGPEVLGRLKTADPFWLAGASLMLVGRFVLWSWRWAFGLRRLAPAGPRPVIFLSLVAAAAVNHLTPTARVLGGLVRARHATRAGYGPFGQTFGTVFFDQIAHQVVMVSATVIALAVAAAFLGREGLAGVLLLVLVAALILALVLSRTKGRRGIEVAIDFFARRAQAKKGRLGRVLGHGGEAVEVVGRLAADRGIRVPVLGLGIGVLSLTMLAQWSVFRALGEPVSLWVVMAGVALGTAAGTALGTPGGVGGTEAALIACYSALGVTPVEAAAGALLYRVLHYTVLLTLGLPALAFLELRDGGRLDPSGGSGHAE